MSAADPQFAGRVIAGRYQLGPRRGSGTDAAVFDAFDRQLQRMVAMKVVHPDLSSAPDFQRSFRQTMDVVASLHHPNLAATHDWGVDEWNGREMLYVVVEHLGGGSLREMLDRGRLLSPSQALVVALDVCRALDTVHRAGIVHGDIRPSTIVFGDDRRLRVIDVGLAQLLNEVLWAPGGHVDNDRAMYASPELANGDLHEPKSDVYSLCIATLEAVTGVVPLVGDSAVATLANRMDKLMPVSADLGPLAAVLERAGRPAAADRYTAAEFGRALVQVAEKLPRPAPIPILGASLFSDRAVAGDPVDPTGPLRRAPAPAPATDAPAAPVAADVAVPAAASAAVPVRAHEEPPRPSAGSAPPAITVPAGGVVADSHHPPKGRGLSRRALAALVVVVALATAGVLWLTSRTTAHAVPALTGLDQGAALNQVSGRGWHVVVANEASDAVPVQKVIRTEPGAGTSLKEGKSLRIVVSTGPAPRALPELKDLTLAAATAQLQAQSLVIEQADPVFDETVPQGQVLSWTVPEQPALKAGDTVTPGTKVRVVLSAGPQPRKVPKLVGLTIADATALLAGEQLTLTQLPDEFSPTVPAGQILRQDPPSGKNVPRDSAVSVAVSKGPDLITMPSLAGMNAAQIGQTLTSAGFVIGTVHGNTNLQFTGAQVAGQNVAAGQQFLRGTTIELFFAT